jgi:hypothetical protein
MMKQAVPLSLEDFQDLNLTADHIGCAVYDMNCLLPLEQWGRGFEFHSRHGYLCEFILWFQSGSFTSLDFKIEV